MPLRAVGKVLLLLLLAQGTATAAMYKWTDTEGNVHYTQTPPPDGAAQRMAPPPPPPISADQAREQLERSRDAVTPVPPPSADIEADRKAAEIARQNCEAARHNLEVYTKHRRIVDSNDQVVVLDDEVRGAKIKEAREQIEKFCN